MNIISLDKKMTWIDIEKPGLNDIEYLKQNFHFDSTVLSELIPDTVRTKVDTYNNFFYIVLHFPALHKEKKVIHSQELDILITKDCIVTLHKEVLVPLKAIFDKCNLYEEEKIKYMSGGPSKLLYFTLDSILNASFAELDYISANIDRVEKAIFQGMEKEMVREISTIKRNILDFRRAIKPQRQILESLNVAVNKFFDHNEEFSPFYNDLLGHHLRIWDTMENYKELTESLESTNTTLFSSKLNETIRILTIFTAIMMPISIIVGFFGMNVSVPLQNHPQGFLLVISIILLATFIIYAYFKKKKIL